MDRLGWAAGISFRAHGLRVGVRTNDPEILPQIEECLPPQAKLSSTEVVDVIFSVFKGGPTKRRGVRKLSLLYFDSARVLRTPDAHVLFPALEQELEISVALMAKNRVFVHAGAVRWKGHAILIPGRSRSGKTSLVAALLRAGADYYSDEYALLDFKGRLHPYAIPLSMRYREGERHNVRKARPEEFGRRTGVKALPVGLVLVSEYKEGAHWRPRRLTPARASLAVLEHCVPVRREPGRVLGTLEVAMRSALVLKGVRGEADEVAPRILKRLERHLEAS